MAVIYVTVFSVKQDYCPSDQYCSSLYNRESHQRMLGVQLDTSGAEYIQTL